MLHYSCNEQTGAVVIWNGSKVFADLTDSDWTFDEKVEMAKCWTEPRPVQPKTKPSREQRMRAYNREISETNKLIGEALMRGAALQARELRRAMRGER